MLPGMGANVFEVSKIDHADELSPLPRVEAPLAAAHSEERRELRHAPEAVLLVEDEPAVRMLAAKVLRMQGYAVLEATNGVEALQVVETHGTAAIDLVLTDVVMPQMGGVLLVEQLKRLRPSIKVIFMSGYIDNPVPQHQQFAHGVTFLQKPFGPAALIRAVRGVLDRV